jgi:hypothetical protein
MKINYCNSTSATNSKLLNCVTVIRVKKSNKLSLLPTGSTTVYQILNPEEITRSIRNMRSLASDQQVSCFY